MSVLAPIRNWWGQRRGYSGCLRCGDSWNWKRRHSLWLSGNQGIFPLCEECWLELSPEQKLHYCEQLFNEWEAISAKHGLSLEDKESLMMQARKAIEEEGRKE